MNYDSDELFKKLEATKKHNISWNAYAHISENKIVIEVVILLSTWGASKWDLYSNILLPEVEPATGDNQWYLKCPQHLKETNLG